MSRFFCFFALFFCFSFKASALSDRAVVKVNKRVLFVSDLRRYLVDLNKFKCLDTKSVLLSTFSLNTIFFSEYPKLNHEVKTLKDNKKFIYSLVKLIKLQLYSNTHKGEFSASEVSKITASKCFDSSPSTWQDGIKSLVQTELFLRQRMARDKKQRSLKSLVETINEQIPHEFYF